MEEKIKNRLHKIVTALGSIGLAILTFVNASASTVPTTSGGLMQGNAPYTTILGSVSNEGVFYGDDTGTKKSMATTAQSYPYTIAVCSGTSGADNYDTVYYYNFHYTGNELVYGCLFNYTWNTKSDPYNNYTFNISWIVSDNGSTTTIEGTSSNTYYTRVHVYTIYSGSYYNLTDYGTFNSASFNSFSTTRNTMINAYYSSGMYLSMNDFLADQFDTSTPEVSNDFNLSGLSLDWDSITGASLWNSNLSKMDWRNTWDASNNTAKMRLNYKITALNPFSSTNYDMSLLVWTDNNTLIYTGDITTATVYTTSDLTNYVQNSSTQIFESVNEYAVDVGTGTYVISAADLVPNYGEYTTGCLGVMPSTVYVQLAWQDTTSHLSYISRVYSVSIDLDTLLTSGTTTTTTKESTLDDTGYQDNKNPSTNITSNSSWTDGNSGGSSFDNTDWISEVEDLKTSDIFTSVKTVIAVFPTLWSIYPAQVVAMLVFWTTCVLAVGVWRLIVG